MKEHSQNPEENNSENHHSRHTPQHEEHDEISIWKKIILGIVALLLITLVVSLTFLSGPVSGVLEGIIESEPIIKQRVVVDHIELIFEDNPYEQLQELYEQEQKTEFSVCLQGDVTDKADVTRYEVKTLYSPKMFQQTFNHVSFEPCNKDSFAILHTHPYKSCIASQTDLNTLENSKLNNPKMLMIVMCEPKRVSVYY